MRSDRCNTGSHTELPIFQRISRWKKVQATESTHQRQFSLESLHFYEKVLFIKKLDLKSAAAATTA